MHIHYQNMHYHIGNVFCVVVRNVHGLISQIQNQIRTIKILSLPYILMSINTLYVVLYTVDALSMKINSVNFVRLIPQQKRLWQRRNKIYAQWICLMSLGVEDISGFPGVFDFGFPRVITVGVPGKVYIWFPGRVFFWDSCESMFTIIT